MEKRRKQPWRNPATMRGAILAGVLSGLLILAGDQALDHANDEPRDVTVIVLPERIPPDEPPTLCRV
ncbi:hypothetical protein [Nocardia sp. NPDC058480]|uniref:hypothetical protein n=1 Tax=Nocardia sp. NPDC058480 TaxID=3346522 RepID=UPI003654F3E4